MPAVPLQPTAGDEAHSVPANPNVGSHATSARTPPAVQPAPAVVDTTSHTEAHVFPRRFLGPMPTSYTTSAEQIEKRAHMRDLRRKALDKLVGDVGPLGIDGGRLAGLRRHNSSRKDKDRPRRGSRTFRIKRKDVLGQRTRTEEIAVGSSSSSEDEDEHKGKKKKKAASNTQDNWVGNSFDIGQEFQTLHGSGPADGGVVGASSTRADTDVTLDDVEAALDKHDGDPMDHVLEQRSESPQPIDGERPAADKSASKVNKSTSKANKTESKAPQPDFVTARTRPPGSGRSSTQDSFVTARTEMDNSDDDTASTFTARVPTPQPPPPPSDGQPSFNSSPKARGSSHASSTRPLWRSSDDEERAQSSKGKLKSLESTKGTKRGRASITSITKGARRLKSALRHGQTDSEPENGLAKHPSKTVKWPEHPARTMSPRGEEGDGDTPPADPREVLARSGDEVEGTSADAAEASVIDDDDYLPGGIVMRDRVLVKVGRHRSENLGAFSESTQRRSPCYRMDSFEEYALGMTMTSVDFYRDWRWSIQEKMKGHKRLCFSVPLSSQTKMSIFNEIDMTLALICPWVVINRQTARHFDPHLRSQTSRIDRAKNGAIADRLGLERTGSAVLIIKFGEISRARDWHWYISGQLGVILPPQIDIRIPAIEQTVRMATVAESASFNCSTVLNAVWEIVLDNTEHTRVLRELGTVPKLELVWKGADARLDWVSWRTTVTNKSRDWALLASFAQGSDDYRGRSLQVRDATHQGIQVKLEDGTMLDEPPGIEGYLTRHKNATAPKESVYISINDGHAFVSSASSAHPPLLPRRLGSSPAELFTGLHKQFLRNEHRRMATFMSECAGCIDLSDVQEVKLVQRSEASEQAVLEMDDADTGGVITESPTASVASPGHSSPTSPKSPTTSSPTSKKRSTTFAPDSPQSPKTSNEPSSPTTHNTRNDRTRSGSSASRAPLPKAGKKREREFEVTLRGDRTVVFEAHTPEIAAEWVERLQQLVEYWTMRQRVDARQAMDAIQLHMGREAFVGTTFDIASERQLNNLWNWCIIDGCRTITLSGKMYLKNSKWSKFKSVYLVLAAGSIVTFAASGKPGMLPRKRVYPLFGAYIYSGMAALDELSDTVSEKAFDPKARVYPDGLQTTDGAEDTTFAVRLTWPVGHFSPAQPWDTDPEDDVGANGSDSNGSKAGSGNGKKAGQFSFLRLTETPQTLLICRARSKLERDRWVWALNCEKERFARSHPRDEEELRNYGTLPRHATLTKTDGQLWAAASRNSNA